MLGLRRRPVNQTHPIRGDPSNDRTMTVSFTLIRSIRFVLNIINILACFVGILLMLCYLQKLKHKKRRRPHKLYVLNLCVSELLQNGIFLSRDLIVMYVSNASSFHGYVSIISFSIYIFHFLSMMCLTLDQLLIVILEIRYNVYFTIRRTKWLILLLWLILAVFLSCLCGSYYINKLSIRFGYMAHSQLTLNIIYSSFLIISYLFVFKRLIDSQRRVRSGKQDVRNIWKPYVPICLTTSYLLFAVVPSIVLSALGKGRLQRSVQLLLFAFSDLCNWWIYLFCQKGFQTFLIQSIRCCCCNGSRYLVTTKGGAKRAKLKFESNEYGMKSSNRQQFVIQEENINPESVSRSDPIR